MPYMELIKTESGVMDVQPVGKSLKVIPSNRWRTPNLHMNCKEWLDNPQKQEYEDIAGKNTTKLTYQYT